MLTDLLEPCLHHRIATHCPPPPLVSGRYASFHMKQLMPTVTPSHIHAKRATHAMPLTAPPLHIRLPPHHCRCISHHIHSCAHMRSHDHSSRPLAQHSTRKPSAAAPSTQHRSPHRHATAAWPAPIHMRSPVAQQHGSDAAEPCPGHNSKLLAAAQPPGRQQPSRRARTFTGLTFSARVYNCARLLPHPPRQRSIL